MSNFSWFDSEDGYGRVFVPRGPWSGEYAALIRREGAGVVRLTSSMGFTQTDLAFLEELTGLRGVEIYVWDVEDASVLATLPRLCLIGLECKLRAPVDLTKLDELEVVKAKFRPALASVFTRTGLRHLNLADYPGEDLVRLRAMSHLRRLQLTSRKLASLRGIDALSTLERLDLHDCPMLSSLDDLAACRSIQRLELTACRAIRSLAELTGLTELTELKLDDSGSIVSLRPLLACQKLEKLSFVGTTRIEDGDVALLRLLPKLHTLRFAPHPHYNADRGTLLARAP